MNKYLAIASLSLCTATVVAIASLSLCGVAQAATEISPNLQLAVNTSGKTMIRQVQTNPRGTSFVLVSSQGTVIAVDGSRMPSGFKADGIAATHPHYDHIDEEMLNLPANKDAVKLIAKAGEKTIKDVKWIGIASSHRNDAIDPEVPDNVIMVFEIDGLRIAHMGDIGQESLTAEQLAQLGKIDVAFMQIENGFSKYRVANGKALKILEQLKPTVVVPTHTNAAGDAKLAEVMGKRVDARSGEIALNRADLDAGGRYFLNLRAK